MLVLVLGQHPTVAPIEDRVRMSGKNVNAITVRSRRWGESRDDEERKGDPALNLLLKAGIND